MSDTYSICLRVDPEYKAHTPTVRLREAIALVLDQHEVSPRCGLTLLVTGDEAVQKLNLRYLGIDAPTDVLSFPTGDDDMPGGEDADAPYLGDIIIAYPYTAHHAELDGHAIGDVLVLLAAHGTLHLLGYDHDTAGNQAEMWQEQEAILVRLGVPVAVLPPPADLPLEDVP
ncbi:MAG: rRNA maturation RNase YbeY [Anaerolineae bacterium]|nr:rRNA maturation RNase YbeY [Anaerolineae bacterium]